MFLINVHQFDVIPANALAGGTLKHKVQRVGIVISLEREDIFVLRTPKDLCEGRKIDPEREVTVATVRTEPLRFEMHRHKGNMRVVHRLQGDAHVVAVKVAILHEVFDGIYDLLEDTCLFETGFQHCFGFLQSNCQRGRGR